MIGSEFSCSVFIQRIRSIYRCLNGGPHVGSIDIESGNSSETNSANRITRPHIHKDTNKTPSKFPIVSDEPHSLITTF